MDGRQHRSTPSSPPAMEPSHPSHSMNALQLIGETYREIDPIEEIRPSERFKSSELMNPGSTPSSPSDTEPFHSVDAVHTPPSMDAMESIREMYKNIDAVNHIDPLFSFIENQLHKMKNPSEAGPSSSEGGLATVRDTTNLAATTIDTISKEAELVKSEAVEEMRIQTLKVVKGVGNLYWVFSALSAAAFGVERNMNVGSQEKECRELLVKTVELAIDVKVYSEQMPDDREKLCNAVCTVVENVVICCDYLRKKFRFWSAKTLTAQLEKTNQQLGKDYGGQDVFLSHSGKQKNFVRQLHVDLTRENVSCFFDEDHNSLPPAEKFPPLIFKAAATCKIAVVVLSKDFILSKWPMVELATFIRAKKSEKNAKLKILPIFFRITPKELDITKNSLEWKKLVQSHDPRGEWQAALKEVQSNNGFPLREDENEVAFRVKVVKAVCNILGPINPQSPRLLEFKPVGIEEQMTKVKALLDMEGTQSALAVVVCGFGGVGKTTLAASVVQSLDWSSIDFKFCMIAIDEKKPDKIFHIIDLQKHIIKKLGGGKHDFQNALEGRSQIKEALKKKRSLLFIDNVVDKGYVRELLPQDLSLDDQETKIRIIITSREKRVKAELNIICKEYEVECLSVADSKSLLLETIVQSQEAEAIDWNEEERMLNNVAAACSGIPLLLSIFGRHLKDERNRDNYQESLDVLREGNLDWYQDEDLGARLMFVYQKIKDVEVKEAFLDICTFFHGWEWNLVADIVDNNTLNELKRRMLVSKSSDMVIVHDILRLLGMKEAGPTRFLNWEKLSDAFEDNLDGLVNVKGISLMEDECLITIKSTQLEAMHQSLRVLMLGDWVTLDGPPCNRAFKNLRYLRVGDISAFPFKDPSKLKGLRVFLNRSKAGMNLSSLPSSLKQIAHEVTALKCDEFAKLPFDNLSSLKSFIVQRQRERPVKLPGQLRLPGSLVHLNLSLCKNLPGDIGHLTALQSLILDGSDLKDLPRGIGELKELKHLSMAGCSKLDSLSEELGMLFKLEALNIRKSQNLRALPESLGGLTSLQKLELSGCTKLELLPESLGGLLIHELQLIDLKNLKKLPNSFGNLSFLKSLHLGFCLSLMSLPDSFVQLRMLQTLDISHCYNLSILPEDFGQLRFLESMRVVCCPLQELPHGFGALGALKDLRLSECDSFVSLPRDFTELKSLESLILESLPLFSRIPDRFGKLQRLKYLCLFECYQLKTLSDDFENMATLEKLEIIGCYELDGPTMEKIVKLQHCYLVNIKGSEKLLEQWRHMQSQIEHPIAVICSDDEVNGSAMMTTLLYGKFVEVDNVTQQLVERSSPLAELEEGTRATVAVIILPHDDMQSHQHQALNRFLDMARETARNNESGRLQILCARASEEGRKVTEEEERAEEEGIRQILLSLPKGSCAIPSSESKHAKILHYYLKDQSQNAKILHYYLKDQSHYYYREDMLFFFMANVGVDVEGRKSFEKLRFIREDKISGNVSGDGGCSDGRFSDGDGSCSHGDGSFSDRCSHGSCSEYKNKHYKSIRQFIGSISRRRQCSSQCVAREFIEALKADGINYLLNHDNGSKVMVDDLHGKKIGLILCDIQLFEWMKLQQIRKDLHQRDSNFICIWIPTYSYLDYGHSTYTRLVQCMTWALPHSPFVGPGNPRFVVVDKEGHIANENAFSLLLAWGGKAYPFTRHTIPESCFLMESKSCLEILLDGMNIVGRKPMKNKLTFLNTAYPCDDCTRSKLKELTKIHCNLEVLDVGRFSAMFDYISNVSSLESFLKKTTQNMCWPSLSLSDMIMFWCRCECLSRSEGYRLSEASNIMMDHTLHRLADALLYNDSEDLALVDSQGVVTCGGSDVVEMICRSSDEISDGEGMRMVKEEVMRSLSRGECTPIVRTFFRDEIHNHPQHPQHYIYRSSNMLRYRRNMLCRFIKNICGVCGVCFDASIQKRSYRCNNMRCMWSLCGSCWKAFATRQVEQLYIPPDSTQQVESPLPPDSTQ